MSGVGLIDAGGANLGSVRYALERLGVDVRMVREPAELNGVQCVILPGVGAAAEGMRRLHAQGLVQPLRELQVPLMGICLGMQLLFERSEEGQVECLGLLPGVVHRMQPAEGVRVPHMGWNTLQLVQDSALMAGIGDESSVYFVHSYAAPVTADCLASCHYGQTFSAVVQRDNVVGMQFHPERSGAAGARLLSNFLHWSGV